MRHSRSPAAAQAPHPRPAGASHAGERGFALFFVLVLILVLTVTGFLTATSTRIDTQIVNTVKNERAAFYAAEAGIAEAHARLVQTGTATANPSGVGSFQASFTGTYAPDASDPLWNAEIVFTAAGTYPSKSGSNVVSPSIQPAASRLAYSTATVGGADNLRMRWARCTAVDPALGCSAVGAIRTIGGQNVLQIVSTGRSGPARRQLLLDLVVNSRTSTVVLRSDACPGVRTQGSGSVNFPGGVVVNSTCATAMSAGGSSTITAAGPISVVGSSTSGNISPTPTTGADPVVDPLAGLAYPAIGPNRRGAGTQALPVKMQVSGTTTLQPGTYFGGIEFRSNSNVTLNPGVYVIAGGGFKVASNAQVQSAAGGVMIFNTCTPNLLGTGCTALSAGQYASIDVSANRPLTLRAMTTTTATTAGNAAWAGIIIFQDRANARPLYFTSGATGDVNGLIYAPIATIEMSGGADLLHSQLLVGAVNLQGGPVIGEPEVWLNIGGGSGTATAVAWADR
jgi:Tfp pilus assembly protein PilX